MKVQMGYPGGKGSGYNFDLFVVIVLFCTIISWKGCEMRLTLMFMILEYTRISMHLKKVDFSCKYTLNFRWDVQILEQGGVEAKLLAKHQGRAHKFAIEPGSSHIFEL